MAIIGPRQVGKTTLARETADSRSASLYLDLEAREDRDRLAEPSRSHLPQSPPCFCVRGAISSIHWIVVCGPGCFAPSVGVPISHQVVPLKRLGVQVNQAPNVSIRRYFPIRESVKALFQADVTNLFNNVVFGGINTTVGNANFGTVSSHANSSRDWQLVGQIEF